MIQTDDNAVFKKSIEIAKILREFDSASIIPMTECIDNNYFLYRILNRTSKVLKKELNKMKEELKPFIKNRI